MINKQQIETIIFGIMIAIFIGYGYHKFILSEQLERINNKSKELTTRSELLITLQATDKDKKSKEKEIEEMEKQLKLLEAAVPNETNTDLFKISLYNNIKKRGLRLLKMDPQNLMRQKGYMSQTISINISGKRNEVLGFITDLTHGSRKARVNEASIRIDNIDELSAQMNVDVFLGM